MGETFVRSSGILWMFQFSTGLESIARAKLRIDSQGFHKPLYQRLDDAL
jgi:hypothetical protein